MHVGGSVPVHVPLHVPVHVHMRLAWLGGCGAHCAAALSTSAPSWSPGPAPEPRAAPSSHYTHVVELRGQQPVHAAPLEAPGFSHILTHLDTFTQWGLAC